MKSQPIAAAVATVAVATALFWVHFQRNAAADLARASARPAARSAGLSLYQLDAVFTSDDGRKLHLADLRGRFQILGLIFTRCPRACPTLVKQIQALERALPAEQRRTVRFALITIDPDHDTPQVLHAYRERMGLGENWTLLNGGADAVRDLAASIGFAYGSNDGEAPVHSKLVTVLDPEGVVVHQQLGIEGDRQRFVDALTGGAP